MKDLPTFATAGRDKGEEELARGLSLGDPKYVKQFLQRTHRPVYAMTARLTTDPDLRHDWCQDILLKVIKEMATGRFVYRRPGCFWAWFQMRANYLLIDQYQGYKKHNDRWSTGDIGAALLEQMPLDKDADPLHLLECLESRRIVEACLEELGSPDHRRAMYLLLFNDQAYQEVAETMGATLNTVRSWIRRARIGMRQCVAGKFGQDVEGK